MAHRASSVVVVWATIVISLAAELVGAQINCAQFVRSDMASYCRMYLQSSTMSTPDSSCCLEVSIIQTVWGSSCYCELYVTVDFTTYHVNPTKAYRLPTDCNVSADMSNCTDPSTIPPPGFTPGTGPSSGTPSTPASASSASKSLVVPIGAAAGGLVAGVLIIGIIWFIVSRCRTSPKPHAREPDNSGDKVPADMNGYGV